MTFQIDAASVEDMFDSANKSKDAEINASDINAPSNAPTNNDNTLNTSKLLLVC